MARFAEARRGGLENRERLKRSGRGMKYYYHYYCYDENSDRPETVRFDFYYRQPPRRNPSFSVIIGTVAAERQGLPENASDRRSSGVVQCCV